MMFVRAIERGPCMSYDFLERAATRLKVMNQLELILV